LTMVLRSSSVLQLPQAMGRRMTTRGQASSPRAVSA
jgi:hypothetical protein